MLPWCYLGGLDGEESEVIDDGQMGKIGPVHRHTKGLLRCGLSWFIAACEPYRREVVDPALSSCRPAAAADPGHLSGYFTEEGAQGWTQSAGKGAGRSGSSRREKGETRSGNLWRTCRSISSGQEKQTVDWGGYANREQ